MRGTLGLMPSYLAQAATDTCSDEAPWIDPSFRELALAALAALGCGLALALGHLSFAAIFGVASAVTIIEAKRRSR